MNPIPRIIHQTWKTRDLPEDYAKYRDSVLRHHLDWDHWLWTDRDNREFIAREHRWFLPTYDSYKHEIERVDAVRYFILYTHGGVYIDLDMECVQPIDALLPGDGRPSFSMLASPGIDNATIGNAYMAAPPGHAFFAWLTRRLPHLRERDITHADVLNNTGPDMIAAQLAAYGQFGRYHVVELEKICGRSVLGEHPAFAGMTEQAIRESGLLYLIHHHSNSWNIQHPVPGELAGYELFVDTDLEGGDIDYVEYAAGDYKTIAAVCDASDEAIAFNFNGYIKNAGGRLVAVSTDNHWLKPGMRAWVCVKKARLGELRR